MHPPTRTRDKLALLVRTVISDVLGTEVDDLDDGTNLAADYGIDSLELMEIGARLESALQLHIEVTDLTSAETVGHAIDLLQARLGGQL
jgi:acyl carrier protein